MAGREGVQHVDSDAGWRLGRCDLESKPGPIPIDECSCQTVTVLRVWVRSLLHRFGGSNHVTVRVRARARVRVTSICEKQVT